MKIGINGFGRIGRLVLRSALERGVDLDIVAINDRGGAKINAHLFQFDSTYGPFRGQVEADSDHIDIDGRRIAILSHLNPLDIPWSDLGVDLVIESTGAFTTGEQAAAHLQAGAERVLVTAPCKGGDAPSSQVLMRMTISPLNTRSFRPPRALPMPSPRWQRFSRSTLASVTA